MALLDSRPLAIGFRRVGNQVVVSVSGELDVSTSQALRQALLDLIDGQGNLYVVIDVGGVTFIDSAGVGVIVGAHRRLRDKGGVLALQSPSRQVASVLDATGLRSTLAVRAS